jgi:hypothetical protein
MGALDVQIAIRKDGAGNVVAELELAKDVEVGLQFVSRLNVVEIGRDEDGDAVTSCIIEAADATPAASKASKPAKLTKSAKNALQALQFAIAERGEALSASNHVPAGVRTVTVEIWRDYAYRMGISASDEPRAKQKAFKSGSEALIATGLATIWEPYVWREREQSGTLLRKGFASVRFVRLVSLRELAINRREPINAERLHTIYQL